MRLLPLVATLLLSGSALAADQYNFKLLGFSKDNKTVAFATSVSQDGSGHGVAVVSVIDVKGNNLLKRTDARDEGVNDEGGSEDVALKAAIAKANLKSYGIDGSNKGQTLLKRLPTDFSSYKNTVFGINQYAAEYELKLSEVSTKSESCMDGESAKMLKLTLKSMDAQAQNPVNLVMQEDKSLPKSRGCVMGYGISEVIKSGNSLVVIVNKVTPGFEGPDGSFMAVTADVEL